MSEEITVIELGEDRYPDWSAFLAGAPAASIYNQPEYLDVLCRTAGGRFRIVAACRSDEILGGVALYERSSAFGRFVAPRLLLYYNGLVLRRSDSRYPSQQSARSIAAQTALASWLDGMGHSSINLRNLPEVSDVRPFLARGWSASPSYSYRLPLDDLTGQWNRVEQNLRRLVQRCSTRDGVQFTDDTDFESFYRLHVITLGRRNAAAYLPKPAFLRYFIDLHSSGLVRLFHARLPSGQPIASQLVLLGPNGTSHTVSAAGDPEFLNLGAHAFLRWYAFEALAKTGCVSNDLTDASLNPVTHFKSQLGGQLTLSLVLQSPKRLRYAVVTGVTDAAQGLRNRTSRKVRQLLGRVSA